MAYGKIAFEWDERVLTKELLNSALTKNEILLGAAESDDEAKFYRNVRPTLLSILEAVEANDSKVPFSEEQLGFLKGLLSSTRSELRESYQEPRMSNSDALADLNRQWALRDRLAAKLEAPFIADTSCDAYEGIFEDG